MLLLVLFIFEKEEKKLCLKNSIHRFMNLILGPVKFPSGKYFPIYPWFTCQNELELKKKFFCTLTFEENATFFNICTTALTALNILIHIDDLDICMWCFDRPE